MCIAESGPGPTDPPARGRRDQVSWSYTIDRELKSYVSDTHRTWKILLYQKDSMKVFSLVLSDMDLRRLYPDFSRNEKAFYDVFRPDVRQTREGRVQRLGLLGQKLSIQQTDVGSVMLVGIKQKPNPRGKSPRSATDIYYPLRESLRQRTILGEVEPDYFTQYTTNARQTVLMTSAKHSGKYLNIIVYYMIPLGMCLKSNNNGIDQWKLKVRVPTTGRQFMAELDGEVYSSMRKKIEARASGAMSVPAEPSSPVRVEDYIVSRFEDEIVALPREVVCSSRSSQSPIQDHYLKNAQMRESSNADREPSGLLQRKIKISAWADIVSACKFVVTEAGNYGICFDQESEGSPVELKETVYDAMLHSKQDGSFVYTEVELRHNIQAAAKRGVKDERATKVESSGLVEDMSGIPKAKWSEYSMLLTIIHMSTMAKYREEVRLNTLMANDPKRDDAKSNIIPYSRIQAYASQLAQKAANKYSSSSSSGGGTTKGGPKFSERESSFFVEDSMQNSGEGARRTANNSMLSGSVMITSKPPLHQPLTAQERSAYYEEMIQAQPPVVARVMMSAASRQVLIRTIDPLNNSSHDTPISFAQISQECLVPLELLRSESSWAARRVLAFYRGHVLRQYAVVGEGTVRNRILEAFTFESK